MAETIESLTVAETQPEHKKESLPKRFVSNHPKTAKVAGITAVAALVGLTVAAVKSHKEDASEPDESDTVEEEFESDPETTLVTEV